MVHRLSVCRLLPVTQLLPASTFPCVLLTFGVRSLGGHVSSTDLHLRSFHALVSIPCAHDTICAALRGSKRSRKRYAQDMVTSVSILRDDARQLPQVAPMNQRWRLVFCRCGEGIFCFRRPETPAPRPALGGAAAFSFGASR